MQTFIHPSLQGKPGIKEADEILRRCVHCGFCTATCPTYQLLGDELDGPRGRIYLIKNLIATSEISTAGASHLDRCLTCRSCETTCPSGVEYGRLLDIGREVIAEHKPVSLSLRQVKSWLVRQVVPRKLLFGMLFEIGMRLRPVLPRFLKQHLPATVRSPVVISASGASIVLLSGCVQSVATPDVVGSLTRILKATGVDADVIDEGCCGALDLHLSSHEVARQRMRQLIDQLYPRMDKIEAIVSSATGCAVTLMDYPRVLKDDPIYHNRALQLVAKLKDPVEVVAALLADGQSLPSLSGRVAVQTPCSMQHGLGLVGEVEALLAQCGVEIVPHREGHLCCGSAGAYSLLEPVISEKLGERKITNLLEGDPDVIVTANIGCQLHLGGRSPVPVMHYLEFLAAGC